MKALVNSKEKNEFRIEERQIRTLNKSELLIKVEYCGVCGSDLHAASNAKGYEFVVKPIILGHEISGTVVQTASVEDKLLINKSIIVVPGESCGKCNQCKDGNENICMKISGLGLHKDGGMAEYVIVKRNQIIFIPKELSLEIAALAEPLSVAVHAVNRIDNPLSRKNILVQGCGIIGMFTAIVAKNKGANVTISGLRRDYDHRLRLAKTFNISTKISDEGYDELTEYDYIFECSGSNIATENIVSKVKKGGTFVLVALYEQIVKLPINNLVRSEIDVLTSYSSTKPDFHYSLKILVENQENFKRLIKVYSLEDGEQAFADARNQKVLKPILKIK